MASRDTSPFEITPQRRRAHLRDGVIDMVLGGMLTKGADPLDTVFKPKAATKPAPLDLTMANQVPETLPLETAESSLPVAPNQDWSMRVEPPAPGSNPHTNQ